MNIYAGLPEQATFQDAFASIQSKAIEQQIRAAMHELESGKGGKYEAVVGLLGLFIGESDFIEG